MSSRLDIGRTDDVSSPAHLPRQAAKQADANRHVQPLQLPIAQPGLKKHDHDQADTDARHPTRNAASTPQHDGRDGLEKCEELQRNRDRGVNRQRAGGSRHQKPCR
jgi:hypothetical protein